MRLPEHLVDPFPEPVGAALLGGLRKARPHDQDVVATGRQAVEPRAPELSQPPLDSVPRNRTRDGLLRDGEAEPRTGVRTIFTREPVERQKPRRSLAIARDDGGDARASGLRGQALPAPRATPLQDRAPRARGHARAEAVPALTPAYVGLIGALHEGEKRKIYGERPRPPAQYRRPLRAACPQTIGPVRGTGTAAAEPKPDGFRRPSRHKSTGVERHVGCLENACKWRSSKGMTSARKRH